MKTTPPPIASENLRKFTALCARHNLSKADLLQLFYSLEETQYGGMDGNAAHRLRSLENENGRLKRLVSDRAVQIQLLKGGKLKKVVSPSTNSGPSN